MSSKHPSNGLTYADAGVDIDASAGVGEAVFGGLLHGFPFGCAGVSPVAAAMQDVVLARSHGAKASAPTLALTYAPDYTACFGAQTPGT